MKILLVTMEYPPDRGGVGNYYFNLVKNLTDHQVEVFKADDSSFYKFFWPRWIKLFFAIKKIIRQEKPDLIWVGQVLPIGEAVYLIKKFFKIPYFVSTHGMDIRLPQKSARKKMAMLKVLQSAEFMTANSQYTKDQLLKLGIKEEKIEVVYPCPHINLKLKAQSSKLEEIKERLNIKDKKIILTVGRLVKRKGQEMVIKLMPRLLEKFPNLVYLIIGEGIDSSKLKAQSSKLGLNDKIVFLEHVSDEELPLYYQLADVFVMPARDLDGDVEGFGMVYLEAANVGLPVIAGKSGGAAEAVVDGQTGLLVNPEDENDVYEKIVKLLSDEGLRNKMGEMGKLRVKRDFQWSGQAMLLSNKIQIPSYKK